MTKYIPAGTGFHVGVNFARAVTDTPVRVTDQRSNLAFGFIPAKPDSPLGFMRGGVLQHDIYIHINARLLRDKE
jgi:hypothetical protein